MPFGGPSSYLTTIDEFIGHWTGVDAAFGSPVELLPGPYGLAELTADRAALSAEITELVEAANDVEGHRTDRHNRQGAIRERMRQFDAFVKGVLAGSAYVGRIPTLIHVAANPGKWLIAMRDHRDVWADINSSPPPGFTPPLLLAGGYSAAMFATDTAALETTLQELTQALHDRAQEIEDRQTLYLSIRARLSQYRMAVRGLFPAGHPLLLSLPRVSPLPGHTPDKVVLSGVWNAETLRADLSWTASEDPDLEKYEVRRSGDTPYDTGSERAVETLPPGTLTLSTNDGLVMSGSTMGFKVYVVLKTGNEKGSRAVTISRP